MCTSEKFTEGSLDSAYGTKSNDCGFQSGFCLRSHAANNTILV